MAKRKGITRKDIEGDREYFRSKGFWERRETVGGRDINFFVIPADPKGELKTFAYQCTSGRPKDGYVIGVSDSVRTDFQPTWAFHEYVEYVELPGVEGRCRKALDEELKYVTADIKGEYIAQRAEFFRSLVRYAKAHPDRCNAEQLTEFRASRDLLNRLERNLKKNKKD